MADRGIFKFYLNQLLEMSEMIISKLIKNNLKRRKRWKVSFTQLYLFINKINEIH